MVASTPSPNAISRRYRRRTLAVLGFVLALLTIPAFLLVSMVDAARPSAVPYDGWITVVADTGASSGVRVAIRPAGDSMEGTTPRVRIEVLVCTDAILFDGRLLLGGSAQLDNATISKRGGAPEQVGTGVSDGYLSSDGTSDDYLGGLQAIPLSIVDVPRCSEEATMAERARGVRFVVEGNLRAPVLRHPEILGAVASRTTQAWPAMGVVGTIDPAMPVTYVVGDGRSFMQRPADFAAVVQGSTDSGAVIESGNAGLTAEGLVRWESTGALTPVATLIDTGREAWLGRSLVFLAIAFGIGGSVVASALYSRLTVVERPPESGGSAAHNAVLPLFALGLAALALRSIFRGRR